jgi:DUF1680 family protein
MITGDSRYGDSLERILYNTVLGSLPMKPDGTAFYYSDYTGSGSKTYYKYKCPCCSGTLGQVVADYGLSAYFGSDRGIIVNLYTPSRVRWQQNGHAAMLEQSTTYPLGSDIELTVRIAAAQQFAVTMRIPAWSGSATEVAVNGKRVTQPVTAGKFLEILRTWSDGDRISLSLEQPLRLEAVDAQHPDLVAAMQGPLALFAVGGHFPKIKRDELLAMKQTQRGSSQWRALTASEDAQMFQPFFTIGADTTTRLYQPLTA